MIARTITGLVIGQRFQLDRIRTMKVWVKDTAGQAVAGEMDIPEGWYCLPLNAGE